MKIDILTLFPKMFSGPFAESIIKRAQEKGLLEIKIHNLRDWTDDKHKTVDDRPFGGGPGMIIKIEPIYKALNDIKSKVKSQKSKVILLTPQGQVFNQKLAKKLSVFDHLILICGHYEGVDERIREHLVDQEISIGDYVLTGGELPAMVITDTIVRLIPGVLEKPEAIKSESFQSTINNQSRRSRGSPTESRYSRLVESHRTSIKISGQSTITLEYPQYTRPKNFRGWRVPKILLSGDHAKIKKWRKEKAIERTEKRRPDLLE